MGLLNHAETRPRFLFINAHSIPSVLSDVHSETRSGYG